MFLWAWKVLSADVDVVVSSSLQIDQRAAIEGGGLPDGAGRDLASRRFPHLERRSESPVAHGARRCGAVRCGARLGAGLGSGHGGARWGQVRQVRQVRQLLPLADCQFSCVHVF